MKYFYLSCASLFALSLGSAAAAAPAAPSDRGATVGEVIVTAQKREERLVDVPISVTAASRETLIAAGVGTTRDLAVVTPGLVTTNNGLAFQPAIRGITSTSTAVGDDGNVAIYVDDVYMANSVANMAELKDVQRVEVLKGPQGTLFGRNATGGAIRIVTREPGDRLQIELSGSYAPRWKERKLDGFLATPLTETLSASLAFSYTKDDGIGKNINPARFGEKVGITDNHAIRGKLLYRPNDATKVVLSADAVRSNNNTPYLISIENNNNVFRFPNTPGVIPNPGEPFTTNVSAYPRIFYSARGVSLTASTGWDDYSLKSITAYRYTRQESAGDLDRSNVSASSFRSPGSQKVFSQELNLGYNGEGRFSWLTGLYYFHANSVARSISYAGDYAPVAAIPHGEVLDNAYAVFGELNFKVIDKLTLTAGSRYNYEKKTWDYIDDFRPAGIRIGKDKDSWQNATYRLTARYEFAPSSNVYASYSTGFKSGTYNTVTFPLNKVDPEKVKAAEIGLKSRISPDLFVTLAAYHLEYDNIQIQVFDSTPTQLRIVLLNAAQAKVTGIEGQADYRLGEHFNGTLGFSLMPKAEYSSFPRGSMYAPTSQLPPFPNVGGNTNLAPIDLSGTRMIRAPKTQVNGSLTYHQDLVGGRFAATVNAAYNSGFQWWPMKAIPTARGETRVLRQKGYTMLNANVSWQDPSEHWRFTVWGENLGDELVGIYEGMSGTGDARAYNRLHTIGMRVDYTY